MFVKVIFFQISFSLSMATLYNIIDITDRAINGTKFYKLSFDHSSDVKFQRKIYNLQFVIRYFVILLAAQERKRSPLTLSINLILVTAFIFRHYIK